MSSKSDFEKIGYDSDCSEEESVRGIYDGDVGLAKVVMENLPQDLLSHPEQVFSENNTQSSTSSFLAVDKLGKLTIGSGTSAAGRSEDPQPSSTKKEDNSWSYVQTNEAQNIAGSSAISSFDALSLNGGFQMGCKTCTLLDPKGQTICMLCGLALNANPCLEMDAQIATNLQLKEEKCAFQAVQKDERKRKAIVDLPVLDQSQFFVDEITHFVECYEKSGFSSIPNPSLTVLALRFIECARENGTQVNLAYHFSDNVQWQMTQIRQDGFGPHVKISSNICCLYVQ